MQLNIGVYMLEMQESAQANESSFGRRSVALLVAVALGVFVGAVFFPTVETKIVEKRVEVPVEVVKYVDRVVEKRIEIPVDRVVEKIVEKRIEVPIEKAVIKYVSDRTQLIGDKPTYVLNEERLKLWMQVKVGMTREQVISILGPPDSKPSEIVSGVIFTWGNGYVRFDFISNNGGLVNFAKIPEY